MITIENADKALKDYYLQAVSAQLNDNISPFFSAIEKSTNNVYGKNVNMAIVRGNSGSVKACAEDSDLPDPYKNRYLGISVPLKNLFGTIEISDKALRASRDSSGAFVNLVNSEMEGLIASAKQNFQRMLFGDGDGTLCKVTKQDDDRDDYLEVDNIKEWFVGMTVDLLDSGGDSEPEAIGVEIIAVDKEKSTITLGHDVIQPMLKGTIHVHGAIGNELIGLAGIFDAKTLYGHDKTAEPYFAPYITKTSTLTEDDLCDVIDYMEESFNSNINMILCSYKTRKKIAQLIADRKRVVNSIDVNTGIGTVSVNNVPVYADKYCPEGVIYFLNTDDFSLNQLCDWEWLEDEGGKILKQVPGKAAYSATLVKYAELICRKPCGQAKLTF